MRSQDMIHKLEQKKRTLRQNHDSERSVDVTRRGFIAASAGGIASFGALGSVGSTAAASTKHTLVIEGFGPATSYSFTVEGALEKSTAHGATTDPNDQIIRQRSHGTASAHGTVSNGKDAYTFTGGFYAFDFDHSGEISVTLDGKSARVDNRPDHVILIEGFGPTTSYSFSVGDYLERNTAYGASVNGSDYITRRGAHGTVSGGKDAYTFSGPLYTFDFDHSGKIQVTLDGKPAHVGRRPENVLVVNGIGTPTSYSFAAGKNVEKSTAYRASLDSSDTITGESAHGRVNRETDAYTFDGSLRSFTFDQSGGVQVTLNGRPAHVGRKPDYELLIEGSGSKTDYTFTVDGSVDKDDFAGASINNGDDLFLQTVTGSVESGKDAYSITGELQTFDFDRSGEIQVTLNGKPAHEGDLPDHLLEFDGNREYGSYDFSVSGAIYEFAGVDESDKITGTSASGAVTDFGSDKYGYDGELTLLSVGGKQPPTVARDYYVIDPDDY